MIHFILFLIIKSQGLNELADLKLYNLLGSSP